MVDTETASAAVAMLGLAIQRRLERGTTDEEVEELVGRHRRESQLIFTLDTLDYLARGGRIGRAAAWAGGLMKVKPILTIRDGEVIPIKRVRGNQRALPGVHRGLRVGLERRARLARRHRRRGRTSIAPRR